MNGWLTIPVYLLWALNMELNIISENNAVKGTPPLHEETIFLGKGMMGVILQVGETGSGSDLLQHISHLDGRESRAESFVAPFGPGTLNSLLDIVGGKDPVDHGDPGLQPHAGDPF